MYNLFMRLSLYGFWATALMSAIGAGTEQPNIVWLVSEDNSAEWLRLYSEGGAPMPNIERLAEQGLVFNHAFSNAAVCSVARSTIISGCYAPRVGAHYHRKQKTVPMPNGVKMFPWYLRQAGYYTTNCSKKDYNFNKNEEQRVWNQSSKKASYRKRAEGQPFFHVQNFEHTHESRLHPSAKDYYDAPKTDAASVQIFPYHPDTDIFRYTYARYLDRHTEVDQQMGDFIAQLEADGLMDDTIIFYYGDHGGALPRGKGYIYNNGLQVPMVVYIPKKWQHLAPAPKGSYINGFVEFVDLSATVLNLAGVAIPAGIDGRPFLGEGVDLEELNQRDVTFGYADRFDEKYDLVRSIRQGKFHYMRNYQPFNLDSLYNKYRYQQPAFQEWADLYHAEKLDPVQCQFFEPRQPESLYDLEVDPHQVQNLAADPRYENVLLGLRRLLRERVKAMPDLGFIPEPVFLAKGAGEPIAYGQVQAELISGLVDIADLSLSPFPEAKSRIANALASKEPLERYWALVTCTSFGTHASPFYEQAKKMAASDESSLVRVRAAEFVGVTGQADPSEWILESLRRADGPYEVGLILNSVALLSDAELGYDIDLNTFFDAIQNTPKGKNSVVYNRARYLRKP